MVDDDATTRGNKGYLLMSIPRGTPIRKDNVVRYKLFQLLIKLKLWPSFYYNEQDCPMTPHHQDFKRSMNELYGVKRD